MATFSLLSDPENYRCDTWDLTNDPEGQQYWIGLYESIFKLTIQYAQQSLVTDQEKLSEALKQAQESFFNKTQQLKDNPKILSPFLVTNLERVRNDVLAHYGLQDPYLKIKHQENIKACNHYHRLVKAHEKVSPESLAMVLTQGIFAGNIFDLGTTATSQSYGKKEMEFYQTLDNLKPRPWLVDDFDAWSDFLTTESLKRVVIFVDNAGPDFVLGCVPLARILANKGTTVYLIANSKPSYNDMTLPECQAVIRALSNSDELLSFFIKTNRIRLIASGGFSPFLDFKNITRECNEASKSADLMILVGMGRALETNWNTRFKCPTLKICMLKDTWMAEKLGGQLYDLLCKFELP